MVEPSNRTYLLVGHVTKDLLPDNTFTIGGTVTYASTVVKRLGWLPTIITAAAPNFEPPAYLADVNWHILPSQETSTFRNEYDVEGRRRQTLTPIAQPIRMADIPETYRHADLVHLAPLTQELEPTITSVFNNSLLAATPQGWMRYWDAQGVVSLGNWRGASEILPRLQAAVVSIDDIEGDWSRAEKWARQTPILVVTQDKLGCTVLNEGQAVAVPPRPAHMVDPTGAGDVFAAAFFIRLHETGDWRHAAYFANVTASLAIERPGAEGAPYRHEVEAYIVQHPDGH
jgi:sugar/nucleoside kinase (ribokinase family)